MKSIRCRLGMHKHVERYRQRVSSSIWFTKKYGVKVPDSDFEKVNYVIILECERDECNDQIAYAETVVEGGPNYGEVEKKTRIHPELAKEELFTNKI